MGLLSEILFGEDSSTSRKQTGRGEWMDPADRYDEYYEDCYDDAMAGDKDARAEMYEEFGDDWEEEE